MDCSCVSDLLFAPPALPALWTPGNWPWPGPPAPSQTADSSSLHLSLSSLLCPGLSHQSPECTPLMKNLAKTSQPDVPATCLLGREGLWRVGEVLGSKMDRIQGSEVLGPGCTAQPAPAQDLRAERGRETGDGQALTEQGREPEGAQTGHRRTNGQGLPGQGMWRHGPACRSPGTEDGLLRSGHSKLGMWTVRLAWMCI